MKPVRVLVVDDSTVIRKIVTDALKEVANIEVVATAAHGRIALRKIEQLRPDVVTLDFEMPEMDGLTTLKQIRRLYPKTQVVMFSSSTKEGAQSTIEALALGASDYVQKPTRTRGMDEAKLHIHQELAPRILQFGVGGPKAPVPQSPASVDASPDREATKDVQANSRLPARVDVISIGSSTGGPNALQQIIQDLPTNLNVPIVVVQHMPPVFTRQLAKRLNQLTELDVREAEQGDKLQPGGIWIAPGDYHMRLRRNANSVAVCIDQSAPENSCRPAVDVLFRSCATLYGKGNVSVVLTGMGQDGLLGAKCVREQGGFVIAQDQSTSVVWGMPRAVTEAGLADKVLPLERIAHFLSSHQSVRAAARTQELAPCR
ncbi:MAG TPA: chemotaxis response regulator protein-glutamate methylesterase [Planctomycetaceae bacterium]|nr:chemotaxis response regulator protein-glutamate methylesterase [Planctomycetaceae bacterium]